MKQVKVTTNNDKLTITAGEEVYDLRMQDFDECVMNVMNREKEKYVNILENATSNDQRFKAIISLNTLNAAVEEIITELFTKCLSETYISHKCEIDDELGTSSFADLCRIIGIEEG